ncbi:MAG: malto-oligosyltrehalose trehalohydrolase [Nitrospirae bacterium RBG_13_39_12]|nr:MAG: malto-oligosyltrehalose trehalohydrolase [Nitrospirae bacterium RBG_13_39_12]
MHIGAQYINSGTWEFVVWAPFLQCVELKIVSPEKKLVLMEKDEHGYWKTLLTEIPADARYFYRLEKLRERPDPASYFQPEGVHGPSQIINHNSFHWKDNEWKGIPLSKMIMYELHVGTFTQEGTFESIITRLDELLDLGINAIEIMPVAQFPGERNWGYDGVYPFAVQNTYGGPDGLKQLVNACHKNGIAVILDVVYNHLGPEGNYLWDYGPYFTDKYKTPWGMTINFDDSYSNEVGNFFIENALHWFKNYHIDALRLDAIHGIYDRSAIPFLQELAERVEEFSDSEKRKFYLIAESDLNDTRVIRPRRLGGYGFDAQWCDDFHHSVHTLLTGEKEGYYIDFGKVAHLALSMKEGFVYSGGYSEFRKRKHGNSSKDIPADQFIVFSQNHDQVGNRMLGERLAGLVSFESLKLAAGAVLLAPYIPLLFMAEEYGEDAPFLYFVDHTAPALIEAVRKGRKEEFRAFKWEGDPPDPQSIETFLKSKIKWEKRETDHHRVLLDFYKHLIRLKKETPALSNLDKDSLDVFAFEDKKVLFIRRWKGGSEVFSIFNFNNADAKLTAPLTGGWRKILDSSENIWNGPGTLLLEKMTKGKEITVRSNSLALYVKERNR